MIKADRISVGELNDVGPGVFFLPEEVGDYPFLTGNALSKAVVRVELDDDRFRLAFADRYETDFGAGVEGFSIFLDPASRLPCLHPNDPGMLGCIVKLGKNTCVVARKSLESACEYVGVTGDAMAADARGVMAFQRWTVAVPDDCGGWIKLFERRGVTAAHNLVYR